MLIICAAQAALLAAILLTYIPSMTHAHGRLIDPPSRMSAWKFGFKVPINYNDNSQYCGGFNNQWMVNNGKCGICGDPWQGPRDYERPNGKMVPNLVITKTYKAGSVIDVQVEVTANHLGWFEFRLCDVRQSGGVEATQACLDRNLMADRRGKTRFDIGTKKGVIKFRLVLPPGLTCPQCVMQWKWHCGNNVGYGIKQEEFYACSDVTVSQTGASVRPPIVTPRPPVVVVTPRPPVVVTNPPVIVTNPPVIVTNPPVYVTPTPPRPFVTITNPPIVTLPPDLLAKLGDKTRPLAERIRDYSEYQKTQIAGYNVWDASQITFRERLHPDRVSSITWNDLANGNNIGGYQGNNNNGGYQGNNNNNNNGGGYYGNNNNNNNNNNDNNNQQGGDNSYFCRLCQLGCNYPDCTKLCPYQCPTSG